MIIKVTTAWNQGLFSQGWLTGHWQLMDGMDELPTEEFCGYTIVRYAILHYKQLLAMFASAKGHWAVCKVKHDIPANGNLATALVTKKWITVPDMCHTRHSLSCTNTATNMYAVGNAMSRQCLNYSLACRDILETLKVKFPESWSKCAIHFTFWVHCMHVCMYGCMNECMYIDHKWWWA